MGVKGDEGAEEGFIFKVPPPGLPYPVATAREKRRALRGLLGRKGAAATVVGVSDALVARYAESKGVKAMYVSGAETTLSMGLPDLGILPRREMLLKASRIAPFVSAPLIVDVDTGYDDVAGTVRLFERAGIAGVQVEDQVDAKRCGHLDPKEVVPAEEMVGKIRDATAARKDRNFTIIARTDAAGVGGMEDAISRANLYAGAGADIIFPEALRTKEEFRMFAQEVDAPLLANMTEFGKTPYMRVSEFSGMGYSMVLFPVTARRVGIRAESSAIDALVREGTQKGLVDSGGIETRDELKKAIDYDGWERVVGDMFAGRPGRGRR